MRTGSKIEAMVPLVALLGGATVDRFVVDPESACVPFAACRPVYEVAESLNADDEMRGRPACAVIDGADALPASDDVGGAVSRVGGGAPSQ